MSILQPQHGLRSSSSRFVLQSPRHPSTTLRRHATASRFRRYQLTSCTTPSTSASTFAAVHNSSYLAPNLHIASSRPLLPPNNFDTSQWRRKLSSVPRRCDTWKDDDPDSSVDASGPPNGHRYVLERDEMTSLVDLGPDFSSSEPPSDAQIPPEKPTRPRIRDNPDMIYEPIDAENAAIVEHLDVLLQDSDASRVEVYSVYRSLAEPRASQLSRRTLDRLLVLFQSVETKDQTTTMRFLSIIDDVKQVHRTLHIHYWNTAIHMSGRSFSRVFDSQVEAAMDVWHELEEQADVSADVTTFNILFDIATKANKFVLADMIREEMQLRHLAPDRFFRTSLILHYGIRGDGEMVRRAYVDLVDAHEVVDTTVINSVISAFIACGELSAAEHLFERQKQLHNSKVNAPLPPSHWRDVRLEGRKLAEKAHRERQRQRRMTLDGPFTSNQDSHPSSEPAQDEPSPATAGAHDQKTARSDQTSVAPSLRTYNMLIRYHAVQIGDIDRVAILVEEMEEYGLSLHGVIFYSIFTAFGIHGGMPYTQWTLARLEQTFLSFLTAVDGDPRGDRVFVATPSALVITAAFLKCAGVVRAADAWLDMRRRLKGHHKANTEATEQRVAASMGDEQSTFWDVIERHLDSP